MHNCHLFYNKDPQQQQTCLFFIKVITLAQMPHIVYPISTQKTMSEQRQITNQNEVSSQNTLNRTEQKIYNAFANILINKIHGNPQRNKNNKTEPKEVEQVVVTSPQSKQVQQRLEDVDFNLLNSNDSDQQSNGNPQNEIETPNNNNFEYSQPQVVEIPKKTIKKSGKSESVRPGSIASSKRKDYKKDKKDVAQNLMQIEYQQPQQILQKNQRPKPSLKKNKLQNQIDTSQMVRIRPSIQIYEDKKLKRSLNDYIDDEVDQLTNKLRQVNFFIQIDLLHNKHLVDCESTDNQATQRQIVPSNKRNPFNKFSKQQSYFQDYSEQSNEMQNQSEKVKQKEASLAPNKDTAKNRLPNRDDSQEVLPVQLKQSKIKNRYNKAPILKANLVSPSSSQADFTTSQADQGLYFKNNKMIVNLAQVSLKDIVKELFIKKIINEGLYKQFVQKHSIHDIKDYIIKFRLGKLHKFDYQNIKFTIMDHRRLAELLVNLYPDRYVIGACHHPDAQVFQILSEIYDLTAQEYYNLYTKIDKISGIKWWSKILITQDERLMESNKERRMARRKAEQASMAVQQLIQNARKKSNVSDVKLSQSQVNTPQEENNTFSYRDSHVNFFGHTEKTRELLKKRRQQIRELVQIREMVSNNFNSKPHQSQNDSNKPSMRKKIRFY